LVPPISVTSSCPTMSLWSFRKALPGVVSVNGTVSVLPAATMKRPWAKVTVVPPCERAVRVVTPEHLMAGPQLSSTAISEPLREAAEPVPVIRGTAATTNSGSVVKVMVTRPFTVATPTACKPLGVRR